MEVEERTCRGWEQRDASLLSSDQGGGLEGQFCLGLTGGGQGEEGTEIKGLFLALLLGLCFKNSVALGIKQACLESCLC